VRKAFTLGRLLHPFLLLVHVLIASSLVRVMDHGKRPREESPEASEPLSHLRALLRGQG
jgi:hypothetical protein